MSGLQALDLKGSTELNDPVGLFLLPLSKGFVGTLEAGEEDVGRIAPPDNAGVGIPISDVKKAVTVFDFSRSFGENLRLKHAHTANSPRSKPERFGSVVEASFRLNELTGVIDGAAVCPRPTVGTKSRFGTVANDNWHPLGAA